MTFTPHRARKSDRLRIAVERHAVDRRTARIPEAEEPRLSPGLASLIYGLATGAEKGAFNSAKVLVPSIAGAALVIAFVAGTPIAFVVAAPVSEELFARGFLYRGWSESFLGPAGAILLSSLVWTALHLQYDWFFFGEVFSIGLLFGYLRYRSNSTWLTTVLHGLNNLAATLQTMWLAGSS